MQRLKEVPNTSQSFVVGGRSDAIKVEVFPERLAGFGIGLDEIAQTITAANSERGVGMVEAGATLVHALHRLLPAHRARHRKPDDRRRARPADLHPRRRAGDEGTDDATSMVDLLHRSGLRRITAKTTRPHASADAGPARRPGRHHRGGEEVRLQRRDRGQRGARLGRAAEGRPDPRQRACRSHPQLRRDREREGQRADLQALRRDRRGDAADLAGAGLPRRRGGADRDPDRDPDHRVLGLAARLHDRQGVAVRADLLDRHPRRRRHRGGREHLPALARRGRMHRGLLDRRGARGRQPDHSRHPHGDRGAAADGLRVAA